MCWELPQHSQHSHLSAGRLQVGNIGANSPCLVQHSCLFAGKLWVGGMGSVLPQVLYIGTCASQEPTAYKDGEWWSDVHSQVNHSSFFIVFIYNNFVFCFGKGFFLKMLHIVIVLSYLEVFILKCSLCVYLLIFLFFFSFSECWQSICFSPPPPHVQLCGLMR